MKLTRQLLSIPPHISTSWDNISALSCEDEWLVIVLRDGAQVRIPDLTPVQLKAIFDAYESYVETPPMPHMMMDGMAGPSLSLTGAAMAHDPAMANSPDIPQEVLEKIGSISQALGAEAALLPKPEAGCNCPHCQIARAISPEEEAIDEEVTEADLTFRSWDIEETSEKLYTVTDPLDKSVQYTVYLGDPIGCTCGTESCEHIKAVLES